MYSIGIASSCAAVLAWLLFKPAYAQRRLRRLLAPSPEHDQPLQEWLLKLVLTALEAFRERRRMPRRWRHAVIELCDGMSSELAAGRTPDEAFTLTAAHLDPPIAAQLLNAPTPTPASPPTQSGKSKALTSPSTQHNPPHLEARQRTTPLAALPDADVRAPIDSPEPQPRPMDRLEKLAQQPGAEGLRLLAACWRIAAEQGGTLAAVLDDLATALRDEEANRQEIATQLAGPRATARLLSVLPLLGLAMAAVLDADPMAFLLGTLPGAGCLVLGVGLNLTGLWWTHRLARSAEEIS
ncbi:type II secretion system F family protein [Actinomadura sp. SCN-SB]|uniref:type II secretion system F family protein n=1 Tax=Actinomadura sp. SCN-SB TaxID=3373092 RepID=UPI0037508C76